MTTEKTNQELAEKNQSTVPAMATAPLGEGHEQTCDEGDIKIPFAKLIQSTSDEAGAANVADRIPAGVIINDLTKEILGADFIPIKMEKSYIQWNPRKKDDPNFDPAFEPGDMVFKTKDDKYQRVIDGLKFGPNGEAPKVTKYMNFLCYFIGHPMPCILRFSKSSYDAGATLNSLTKFYGGNMRDTQFKVVVVQRENDGSKFFVLAVQPVGPSSDEVRAMGKKWYDAFGHANVKVQEDTNDSAS